MRILLVEEDHLLARIMLGTLREEQNTLDWLDDGQQALNALGEEHFDLAILDLTLPRIDGLDILRRSRQQGNQTPIIILTARTDLDEKLQGLEVHIHHLRRRIGKSSIRAIRGVGYLLDSQAAAGAPECP